MMRLIMSLVCCLFATIQSNEAINCFHEECSLAKPFCVNGKCSERGPRGKDWDLNEYCDRVECQNEREVKMCFTKCFIYFRNMDKQQESWNRCYGKHFVYHYLRLFSDATTKSQLANLYSVNESVYLDFAFNGLEFVGSSKIMEIVGHRSQHDRYKADGVGADDEFGIKSTYCLILQKGEIMIDVFFKYEVRTFILKEIVPGGCFFEGKYDEDGFDGIMEDGRWKLQDFNYEGYCVIQYDIIRSIRFYYY